MAINIKNPPALAFAKNDIFIGLDLTQGNFEPFAGGTKTEHILGLNLSATPTNIEFFFVKSELVVSLSPNISFNPQQHPNDPLAFYPLYNGTQNQAVYYNELAAALSLNPVLGASFDITAVEGPFGTRHIRLVSKTTGDDNVLLSVGYGQAVPGFPPSSYRLISQQTPGTPDNFITQQRSVNLRIESVYNSDLFDTVINIPAYSDDKGQVFFNLAPYLRDYFPDDIPAPIIQNDFIRLEHTQLRYQVYLTNSLQYFYDQNQPKYLTVLRGGLGRQKFAEVQDNPIDLYFQTHEVFLRTQGKIRMVTPESPQFLAFLSFIDRAESSQFSYPPGFPVPEGAGGELDTYRFMAEVFFADNSTAIIELARDNHLQFMQAGYFNCSPSRIMSKLQGSSHAQKPMLAYEVYVLFQDSQTGYKTQAGSQYRITERIRYELIPPTPDDVHFIYANNWGVYETVTANGFPVTNFSNSKLTSRKVIGKSYNPTDSAYHHISRARSNEFDNIITFFSDDQASILEFLDSERIFIYDNGKLIPVLIPADSWQVADKDTESITVEFSYKHAFDESAHTPEL